MRKLIEIILNKHKTAALAAVFVSICVVGCSPDDKEDPVPSTPGTNPKLRFVADWTCTEVSNIHPTSQPFQVHCTNSTGDTVLLENFYALGFQNKVKAVIYGDSIRIAPNNQAFSGIVVMDGRGKLINTSKFTMNYRVHDGSAIDSVNATFTK